MHFHVFYNDKEDTAAKIASSVTVYPEIDLDASINASYPAFEPLLDILTRWPPDDPNIPTIFTESLMHFNYSNLLERSAAEAYRNKELPFKVYDVPEFEEASKSKAGIRNNVHLFPYHTYNV